MWWRTFLYASLAFVYFLQYGVHSVLFPPFNHVFRLLLSFKNSLCIKDKSQQLCLLQNVSTVLALSSYNLHIVFFKLQDLIKIQMSSYFFCGHAFNVSKNSWRYLRLFRFSPTLFCRNFKFCIQISNTFIIKCIVCKVSIQIFEIMLLPNRSMAIC